MPTGNNLQWYETSLDRARTYLLSYTVFTKQLVRMISKKKWDIYIFFFFQVCCEASDLLDRFSLVLILALTFLSLYPHSSSQFFTLDSSLHPFLFRFSFFLIPEFIPCSYVFAYIHFSWIFSPSAFWIPSLHCFYLHVNFPFSLHMLTLFHFFIVIPHPLFIFAYQLHLSPQAHRFSKWNSWN